MLCSLYLVESLLVLLRWLASLEVEVALLMTTSWGAGVATTTTTGHTVEVIILVVVVEIVLVVLTKRLANIQLGVLEHKVLVALSEHFERVALVVIGDKAKTA